MNVADNFNFKKTIRNPKIQNLSYINYAAIVEQDKKVKVILIKNCDESKNRNTCSKLNELTKLDTENKFTFFEMENNKGNTQFIKKKLDLEFETYPQMIVLKDDKKFVIKPEDLMLYKSQARDIYDKISELIKH